MTKLQIEVAPGAVGFDGGRLDRIDSHFRRYVDDGRLPGWLIAVARGGKVAHLSTYGRRDIEADKPVELDTLFRIYSMTKPVTSVAAMMLYEQGAFELRDPVSKYIPSFADMTVYKAGSALNPMLVPAVEPVRIWHLLTHTSGLTYGFHHAHPVDAMYRAAGYEWWFPEGVDLAGAVDAWAALPLLFHPGDEWNYGVSTDVLGRVVEVVSGQPLDAFFADHVFGPLGMTDTSFAVDEVNADRLGKLYTPEPGPRTATRLDALGDLALSPPPVLSGGGGLISTAADYHRFAQMLLNRGELDGVRLLGPRTVDYMASNHLPGDADLTAFGRPLFAEIPFDGVGFGLGFHVVQSPVSAKVLQSRGEFGWGGAASTAFWIDPVEQITALFMTQLLPSSAWPLRTQLKQLVYQALVD
ncbi:MAG: serine hydrolase domain-containing protein [Mycobacteriales bacterium]